MHPIPYTWKDDLYLPEERPAEEWFRDCFLPPALLEELPAGLIEDQA